MPEARLQRTREAYRDRLKEALDAATADTARRIREEEARDWSSFLDATKQFVGSFAADKS